MVARDQAGEDIAGLGAAYDAMLKALTAAQIQEAAKKYFDTNELREVRVVAGEVAPSSRAKRGTCTLNQVQVPRFARDDMP